MNKKRVLTFSEPTMHVKHPGYRVDVLITLFFVIFLEIDLVIMLQVNYLKKVRSWIHLNIGRLFLKIFCY